MTYTYQSNTAGLFVFLCRYVSRMMLLAHCNRLFNIYYVNYFSSEQKPLCNFCRNCLHKGFGKTCGNKINSPLIEVFSHSRDNLQDLIRNPALSAIALLTFANEQCVRESTCFCSYFYCWLNCMGVIAGAGRYYGFVLQIDCSSTHQKQ